MLFCGLLMAQTQSHFDSWTTDQGLPQNSVLAVLQSRDHYLWVATSDGLVRFDGLRFTIFNKSNTSGIEGNRFTSLYEDREGTLWIGTDGAGLVRYRNGVFTTYSTSREVVTRDWIQMVTGDATGHLWMFLNGRIAQWIDGHLLASPSSQFPKGDVQFSIIGPHNPAGIWSRSKTTLAIFVHGKTTAWPAEKVLGNTMVRAVAEDRDGTVWIAGDGGLASFRNGELAATTLISGCSAGPTMFFLFNPKLNLACKDGQNNLAIIPTDSLQRRDTLHIPVALADGLTGASFYEDDENNLWIGTNAHGLYRARKQLITVYAEGEGLNRNIYPIYQDRAGAIWLGTWGSTLSRLHDGKVTNYASRDGLASEITSLFEDRSGRLWVGCYSNGVRVFQNGRFVVPKGLENLGVVSAMFQDREGALWFGTDDKVVRYVPGSLKSYTGEDGLAATDARVIIEDAAGGLWIGGIGGLTHFQSGRFTAFTERDGLPSNSVRALYEDLDGVLWIGTYDGGLGRFKDNHFTRYTTREGLFNNGVFQILEDGRGNLWMSSNQGIYRVEKRALNQFAAGKRSAITSIAYGKSDGLLNLECNGGRWPAGIKARDGKLWFPTQDGAAVIDPTAVSINPRAPPMVIESILVNHLSAPPDQLLRLHPGQDNLEIRYTALSFINSEHLEFRYKLEGLDRDWVNAGTRRTAYYSHLPPGDYVFRVIGANSDGVWNMQGSSLGIAMLPSFYQTRWFLTSIWLSAAGIVWLAWRYRLARFERAHALQQAFTRQLIHSQESERKRIAAELHDSLGQRLVVIKNLALIFLNDGAGGGGATKAHIEEISGEASHALNEVREISFDLRPYQLDRLGLTQAVEAIIRKASRATSIDFMTQIVPIDNAFPKDLEINFYRIVQECVSNLIRHSEATKATVEISRGPGRLLLTIRDNGRGFTPGAADRNRTSGGFGLIGISERAQSLGGNLQIESAPGRGTMIRIEVPVSDGHPE